MKKEEQSYDVYGLKDPITNLIMYVGISINVEGRYRQHIFESKNTAGKKNEWIRELMSKNLNPELVILDSITTDDRKKALNLESYHINQHSECLNIYEKEKVKFLNEKKIESYLLDEYLVNYFDMITIYKKVDKTDVINELIRDYVITNKAEVNEFILSKNKIDN